MVVPFAAGGATDVIARLVAEGLRAELGQPVIIENIGGAGGMIGSSRVAKAPPDGYQIVLGNVGTHAHNQSIYKKPLYNASTDFTPVALIADQSLVLVARKDFPAGTMAEFVAYVKANQAKLQYGSSGTGGSNHLGCVLLNSAIGTTSAANYWTTPFPGTVTQPTQGNTFGSSLGPQLKMVARLIEAGRSRRDRRARHRDRHVPHRRRRRDVETDERHQSAGQIFRGG